MGVHSLALQIAHLNHRVVVAQAKLVLVLLPVIFLVDGFSIGLDWILKLIGQQFHVVGPRWEVVRVFADAWNFWPGHVVCLRILRGVEQGAYLANFVEVARDGAVQRWRLVLRLKLAEICELVICRHVRQTISLVELRYHALPKLRQLWVVLSLVG